MSPELEKRKAIAEAIGWRDIEWYHPPPNTGLGLDYQPASFLRGRKLGSNFWQEVPDFPTNPLAMAEAEATLDAKPVDVRSLYYDYCMINSAFYFHTQPKGRNIRFEVSWQMLRCRTAARAEAFFQMLNHPKGVKR